MTRARVSFLLLLLPLAFPGVAGAATVSVEPFAESPNIDPFGSCSRYMSCPPDMVVFTAGAGEANQVSITAAETLAYQRIRWLVHESGADVQVGKGCEQVDPGLIACVAGTVGPVELGDGEDRMAGSGDVSGGPGADVLNGALVAGDEGDDVVIASEGSGGPGDDLLEVRAGSGDSGDDDLRCFPHDNWCWLDGGPGNDRVTGGSGIDHLFGREGDDVMQGGGDFDTLVGGRGDDRLVGGAGGDHLGGGSGADRLVSREDRSSGEAIVLDRVDCGTGRLDRAVADRRDDVKRCERVRLP